MDDAGQRVPGEWFDVAVDWALAAIEGGGTVLTHCHMGVNRGPSLGFAVLLEQGWDPIEALDAIRTARPIAWVAYAEDALRWHHERVGVSEPEPEGDHVRLDVACGEPARPRRGDPPEALDRAGETHPPIRSSSQLGLIVRHPSASTRWRSARSAVITTTSSPAAHGGVGLGDDGGVAVLRGVHGSQVPVATAGTPAFACPSSTSTISSYDVSATASRPCSRAAAPARSRHHPSGRDPTTFAPSTTSTRSWRVTGAHRAGPGGRTSRPSRGRWECRRRGRHRRRRAGARPRPRP